jgi:hypothetical protein
LVNFTDLLGCFLLMDRDMDSLGQVIARRGTAVSLEWGARITIVAVFIGLAAISLAGLRHFGPVDGPERLLATAARLANFMFLILIAATALTRLAPVRNARGIGMRPPHASPEHARSASFRLILE